MDKLEEYIMKNRENLDLYIPSPNVCRKIRKGSGNGKLSKGQWISIAAMVVVILATTAVLYNQGRWQQSTKLNAGETSSSNPQLKETEIYYTNMINSLYREATPMLTGNPEIKKELNTDILQLDSICTEIKKDLKDNIANQEVVEALIQNYRLKIRLLEDMLIILKENEKNPEKSKSYEL
jgi:hypothetical protein